MNLLILENHELKNDVYVIKGRKYEHITKVLKSKVNDKLQAGVLNIALGEFLIQKIDHDLKVIEGIFFQRQNELTSKFHRLNFYFAFQRPQTTKKILHLASLIGVGSINFFRAEKSEKSYEDSNLWKNDSYIEEMILGLEQGKRVNLPKVEKLKSIYNINFEKEFIVLEPNSKILFNEKKSLLEEMNPVMIFLGPESGFVEKEIEYLEKKGGICIKVSNSILRTEQAFAFSLSQIEFLL
ncbi:MAG: RsmE family RNA methyltransferase [Leptospiraceae bacterium]|nr:RsmE family RNA methyltransferase [Leptospiraceae bacterium]